MLQLLIAIAILCSSLGATLSKYAKAPGVRAERKHTKPLILDREV